MATRDTPVSIARLRAVQPVILGLTRPRRAHPHLEPGGNPCLFSQPFPTPAILAATPIPCSPSGHRGGKISVHPVVDVADHQSLAMAYTLVGTDAAAGYVIPSQFDERVAPAVAAAVAAQARADSVARR